MKAYLNEKKQGLYLFQGDTMVDFIKFGYCTKELLHEQAKDYIKRFNIKEYTCINSFIDIKKLN